MARIDWRSTGGGISAPVLKNYGDAFQPLARIGRDIREREDRGEALAEKQRFMKERDDVLNQQKVNAAAADRGFRAEQNQSGIDARVDAAALTASAVLARQGVTDKITKDNTDYDREFQGSKFKEVKRANLASEGLQGRQITNAKNARTDKKTEAKQRREDNGAFMSAFMRASNDPSNKMSVTDMDKPEYNPDVDGIKAKYAETGRAKQYKLVNTGLNKSVDILPPEVIQAYSKGGNKEATIAMDKYLKEHPYKKDGLDSKADTGPTYIIERGRSRRQSQGPKPYSALKKYDGQRKALGALNIKTQADASSIERIKTFPHKKMIEDPVRMKALYQAALGQAITLGLPKASIDLIQDGIRGMNASTTEAELKKIEVELENSKNVGTRLKQEGKVNSSYADYAMKEKPKTTQDEHRKMSGIAPLPK